MVPRKSHLSRGCFYCPGPSRALHRQGVPAISRHVRQVGDSVYGLQPVRGTLWRDTAGGYSPEFGCQPESSNALVGLRLRGFESRIIKQDNGPIFGCRGQISGKEIWIAGGILWQPIRHLTALSRRPRGAQFPVVDCTLSTFSVV